MYNILIVTPDMYLRSSISEILSGIASYNLHFANNFDNALSTLLQRPIDLALVHQSLGGLHGLDLIAVVAKVKPGLPFILFDDDISSRTAMSAFRLGARDYMTYPLRPHLLHMQISRCLQIKPPEETQETPRIPPKPVDYASLLDPDQRALALSLSKRQHQKLHTLLSQTATVIDTSFAGVLDKNDNIVDAVGDLATLDIRRLKQIAGIDTQSNQKLADILGIDRFTATFWEGEAHNVYMLEIEKDKASFIVIAPAQVKAGAVWFQLKQTAKAIKQILDEHNRVTAFPIFT